MVSGTDHIGGVRVRIPCIPSLSNSQMEMLPLLL